MVNLMSRSCRRGAVALVMAAAAALLVAAAQLQPEPTPSALASNGTIHIGTHPPT
jgi:opacity protein-like surface antigen